jgi:hypothetical protein
VSNSPDGTQVSMSSVIEVQRQRIAQLTEENIMLLAALNDREKQIEAMSRENV